MKITAKNTSFASITLSILLSLPGCTTLSKRDCQNGDWYNIGLEDGRAGKLSSHINKHVKACSSYNIHADHKLWQKGRQEGLRNYCTPASAYQKGLQGFSLAPVCGFLTQRQLNRIQSNHYNGKRIYRSEQKVNRLERDILNLQKKIDKKRRKFRKKHSSFINHNERNSRTHGKSTGFIKNSHKKNSNVFAKNHKKFVREKKAHNYELRKLQKQLREKRADLREEKYHLNSLEKRFNF